MAGKNNAANRDIATVKDAATDLMLTGETNTGLTYSDLFDTLKKADLNKMQNLSKEYFKFDECKKGQRLDFLFEGMSTATIDGKTIDVVEIRDESGKAYINGNAVLVGALRKVTQMPALFSVVFNGTQKSSQGTYVDLTVYIL